MLPAGRGSDQGSKRPGRFRDRLVNGANYQAAMPRFPHPNDADEMGLVAVGGDLEPATLLEAYRSGIFPWFDDLSPICWWSPDPRAIIELVPRPD